MPRMLDDVVPRQSPMGYEYSMVLIQKPVEATPKLLRAPRWFCQNPFGSRRDLSFFTLAEQSYTTHISASHRARIFFSRDHLVAIRKTVCVLALFNTLEHRVDVTGRWSPDTWKFVDGGMRYACGNAFFMRNIAQLKVCAFSILP